MNEIDFEKRFGVKPVDDDLERANCQKVGEIGHFQCGICDEHNKPRFMCGCIKTNAKAGNDFLKTNLLKN